MKPIILAAAIAAISSHVALANDEVSYQYPMPQSQASTQSTQTLHSDEYWQTVSGKELREGIALDLGSQSPLIRVSAKARFDNGQVLKGRKLELSALQLVSEEDNTPLAIADMQLIAQQDMARAGFEDDSIALKPKGLKKGVKFRIRSQQALNDDDAYLIHVKEKDAGQTLSWTGERRLKGKQLAISSMTLNGLPVNPTTAKYELVGPNDKRVGLKPSKHALTFDDELEYVGARNGLYQVVMTVERGKGANKVKRSMKVPFVNFKQTAEIVERKIQRASSDQVDASVTLNAVEPGRYSVKATLVEIDRRKGFVPLATVETAKTIDGTETLTLPFKVNSNGRRFVLQDVVVKDLTRMLVLTH